MVIRLVDNKPSSEFFEAIKTLACGCQVNTQMIDCEDATSLASFARCWL
jgi:hypothetical protein